MANPTGVYAVFEGDPYSAIIAHQAKQAAKAAPQAAKVAPPPPAAAAAAAAAPAAAAGPPPAPDAPQKVRRCDFVPY